MTSAAGHTFDPITHRCILTRSDTGNVCGRHELDLIPYADKAYVDQEGIAHVGKLYEREVTELVALAEKWKRAIDAGNNRTPPVQALDAALEAEMQAANEPDPYCFWAPLEKQAAADAGGHKWSVTRDACLECGLTGLQVLHDGWTYCGNGLKASGWLGERLNGTKKLADSAEGG